HFAASIWVIKGREFAHCSCAYGCPQFNALPTHGNCQAVVGMQIDKGHHRDTQLDGLRFAGVFAWPGPIHDGHGEAFFVIDERANTAQREALLRIVSGLDTEPGATLFQVYSTTFERVYNPIFDKIAFDVDVEARTARLIVGGMITARGAPILDQLTGK